MKTIVPNAMVAHIWANQSQSTARSGNGNFWFEDDTIYSYRTPIARIVTAPNGRPVVLRTSEVFSITTSGKHENAISRALGHTNPDSFGRPVFFVPCISPSRIFNFPLPDHSVNVEYFLQTARGHIAKAKTARLESYDAQTVNDEGRYVEPSDKTALPAFLHTALTYFRTAAQYVELFEVKAEFDGGAEVLAALEVWRERLAKYNDPRAVHKRELARAARERAAERVAERERAARQEQLRQMFEEWQAGESQYRPRAADYEVGSTERAALEAAERQERAERYAAELERRNAWLRGENVSFYGHAGDGYSALIRAVNVERDQAGRIIGGTLQTSQGASVPLTHAIKVFRFLKLIRERGEGWHRNGQTVRVGHFQVDSIEPDGSFKAGCHRFRFEEVQQLATELGVFDLPPDDSATESSHKAARLPFHRSQP